MTSVPELTYPGFDFETIKASDVGRARLGRLVTPHGVVETPAFVFCATKGSIKAADPYDLEAAGAQFMLSNTYHLMLRPGGETIERVGGLHRFTGWNGPMLTDSGGFQVFSLGHGSVADEIKGTRHLDREKTLLKITEEGAHFKAYTDGSRHLLTPERALLEQRRIGADLVVAFDECTPFRSDRSYTAKSLERTHRWGDRSIAEFDRHHDGRQALYGVLQGGVHQDLRVCAAQWVSDRPFFGHAVGGTLGGTKDQMVQVVDWAIEPLRRDRPVHLLGIGGVDDLWEGVERGVDTFDCVGPTRIARHGWALTRDMPNWRRNLKNARFKEDDRPLDESCDCPTCARFPRALIHHLFKAHEIQAQHHVTVHNVHFMTRLMRTIRQAITEDRFAEVKREWLAT